MEKRYQVFISSTFKDLENARQEVSQALLRADCFPAGMELFPAADEEQFEFIKTVIDQSDYYIIISAGRYGSIHPESGVSYTEMEYDYAVEIGKPIIRLLHKDPFNLLRGDLIEPSDRGRKLLQTFREKMSHRKMVKFWQNELELGNAVDHSLRHLIKTTPAIGWLPANEIDKDARLDNFKLKEQLSALKTRAATITANQSLSLNLPVVKACFEKMGFRKGENEYHRVWAALEEAFLHDHQIEESELAFHISDNGGVEDDDNTHAIMDALVVDGLLDAKTSFYSLTAKGRQALRKMRVQDFLS